MIKLFASDLDGTLLNGLHEADRTIRGAIQEAIAQGAHAKAGSKLTKAESLGVPVLDEEALERILATGEVPQV